MAKKSSGSSKNKTVKATAIVILVFALVAGLFLFFNKDKSQDIAVNEEGQKVKPKVVNQSKMSATPSSKTMPQEKQVPVPVASTSKVKRLASVKDYEGKGIKIAFVIDDWGYRMTNCHYLKEIQAPLAVSILPNLKHTTDIMKCASVYDKDIMLHLPLEPYHNYDPYPDNYLITGKMPTKKVESLISDTFKKMPLISGVNNHMGSKAMEDKALMRTVLKKVKEKGLFFIDSMTSPHHSVGGAVADELKVPFAQRDVFLDNVNTREAIEKQFVELAQKAKRKGYAIAISHDRTLSMQMLKEQIPILQKQGFEIVHVKELLRNKN